MSERARGTDAIFVERSWPPLRIWVYFLLPAVIAAVPAPFLGSDYWAGAGGLVGGYLIIFGLSLLLVAGRHWWFSPEELGISGLSPLARIFYGFSGKRRIPLPNIDQVETVEGKTRALRTKAFGTPKPTVEESFGGSCEKPWCKSAVIVRLRQSDEYGDTALLSTPRPQEASSVLIQAIRDEQQRRGTAT